MSGFGILAIVFGGLIVCAVALFVINNIFFYEDWLFFIGLCVSLLSFFGLLISVCVGIDNKIKSKREYAEYIEIKAYIEETYKGGNDFIPDYGISNSIIEVNQWLAKAKASKKSFGRWSKYYSLDLSEEEFIKLEGRDESQETP